MASLREPNAEAPEDYVVNSKEECRCSLSRSAYDMVLLIGGSVSSGCIVASPVKS
jgi:hypothetical protein